jgi:hypothetical protein
MNPEVTPYFDSIAQEWQAEVAKRLRQLVHDAIPEAQERLQYGKPHFLKSGKYAAVLGTAKGWVSFTIFNATDLEAPDGFFEPGPPERKTIKILPKAEVDYDLLAKLVKQAASTIA